MKVILLCFDLDWIVVVKYVFIENIESREVVRKYTHMHTQMYNLQEYIVHRSSLYSDTHNIMS